MDFTITPEQQAFRDSVARWAAEVVAPGAAERDQTGTWDPAVWKSLAAQGLAGLLIPEEYGGGGASSIAACTPTRCSPGGAGEVGGGGPETTTPTTPKQARGEGGAASSRPLPPGPLGVIGSLPIALHG